MKGVIGTPPNYTGKRRGYRKKLTKDYYHRLEDFKKPKR